MIDTLLTRVFFHILKRRYKTLSTDRKKEQDWLAYYANSIT